MHQHAPAARTSPWAVASLVSSLLIFCPFATMIGPALGVKAIADIRAKPGVKGGKFAAAGIIIGLLATFGWILAVLWWDSAIRQPILSGPEAPLRAGFAGNVAGFKKSFYGRGSELPDEQAVQFINELTRRYGPFQSITQAAAPPAEDQADNQPQAGQPAVIDPTIAYVMTFDNATVPLEAEFVVFPDSGMGVVGKWRSITILDDEHGNLRYPP